jgi:hypothetical protein
MKIYKNVLSDGLLKNCLLEIENNKKRDCWALSNFFWDNNIKKGVTGGCAVSKVSEHLRMNIKDELCNIDSMFNSKITCQFYVWNSYSGISSHNDAKHKFGGTIYLNSFWDIDYGGVFLWDENDKVNAFCPEYNSMIVNAEKQIHRVTSISPVAPYPRLTIQIWGTREVP